jgi:hypothetical protein
MYALETGYVTAFCRIWEISSRVGSLRSAIKSSNPNARVSMWKFTELQLTLQNVTKYFILRWTNLSKYAEWLTWKKKFPRFATWQLEEPIDCRCEGGGCPVSASWVTIWKPDLLSSCETQVNPVIRSWRKHSSEWVRCQKAIAGIYLIKKWRVRLYNLVENNASQEMAKNKKIKKGTRKNCTYKHVWTLVIQRFWGFLE